MARRLATRSAATAGTERVARFGSGISAESRAAA